MNKFTLLVCFILVLNVAKSQIDPIEQIYDYATVFLKGMALTDRYECANAFIKKKSKLFPTIKETVETSNNMSYFSLFTTLATQLFGDKEIRDSCNIMVFIGNLSNLRNDYTFKLIGNNINTNAQQIYDYVKQIQNASSYDEKLFAGGHILSLITNFYVY